MRAFTANVRVAVCFLVVVTSFGAWPSVRGDTIDLQLEQEFDALVREETKKLGAAQRLVPSKNYQEMEDGRYRVTAYQDTADGEQLKSERYTLIFESAGGRKCRAPDIAEDFLGLWL